ncbi:MAG TPA: putative quinol monooxygenase [Solirubrobacteraceae bacterium]|nr:putative quinol monooxygenase [Solirubrobacteraceae bacterium]
MIVVTGRVQIPEQNRERFLEIATAMCSASRADGGCAGYRVYEDAEQPGRFVFIEEWQDDDALQAHFRQPHTGAFMSELPGLLGEAPDALFHTVTATRRLDPARGLVDAERG